MTHSDLLRDAFIFVAWRIHITQLGLYTPYTSTISRRVSIHWICETNQIELNRIESILMLVDACWCMSLATACDKTTIVQRAVSFATHVSHQYIESNQINLINHLQICISYIWVFHVHQFYGTYTSAFLFWYVYMGIDIHGIPIYTYHQTTNLLRELISSENQSPQTTNLLCTARATDP